MSSLGLSAMRLAEPRVKPLIREAECVAKIGIGPGLTCCPIGRLPRPFQLATTALPQNFFVYRHLYTASTYTFVECLT